MEQGAVLFEAITYQLHQKFSLPNLTSNLSQKNHFFSFFFLNFHWLKLA